MNIFHITAGAIAVALFVWSCSPAQRACERGSELLAKGKWDDAIPLLEECERSKREEVVKEFGKPITAGEAWRVLGNSDKVRVLSEWWEAVLNLASAYIGKAGFDWLNLAGTIAELSEQARTYQQGTTEQKEQALENSAKIAKEKIFGGYDERFIKEALAWSWKAQRLISDVLYGDPQFIDKFLEYNVDRRERKEKILPNVPEMTGTRYEFNPQTPQEWHLWRIGNNLEFLLAKTLFWKVGTASALLGYFDWVLEREKQEQKEGVTKLPPLCCLFVDATTSPDGKVTWSSPTSPYELTIYDATDMIADLVGGVVTTFRFSTGVSEGFVESSTSFYDVIDSVVEGIASEIDQICQSASDELTRVITETLNQIFSDIFAGTGLQIFVFAEAHMNEPYVWVCPRIPTRQIVEPQRFMCYPGYIDIPEAKPFPSGAVGIFLSSQSPEPLWVQDGQGCKRETLAFAGEVTQQYTVLVYFTDSPTTPISPVLMENLCEQTRDIFAEFNAFLAGIQACEEARTEIERQICTVIEKTNELVVKVEREINGVRALPKKCAL